MFSSHMNGAKNLKIAQHDMSQPTNVVQPQEALARSSSDCLFLKLDVVFKKGKPYLGQPFDFQVTTQVRVLHGDVLKGNTRKTPSVMLCTMYSPHNYKTRECWDVIPCYYSQM